MAGADKTMDELILFTTQLNFIIKYSSNWSDIYISKNDSIKKLGSQALDVLISDIIISFLNIKDRKYFEYMGDRLFTISNLMDSHSVIAGKYINDDLELIHLDTYGKKFYLCSLNENQRIDWIKQIFKSIISKI